MGVEQGQPSQHRMVIESVHVHTTPTATEERLLTAEGCQVRNDVIGVAILTEEGDPSGQELHHLQAFRGSFQEGQMRRQIMAAQIQSHPAGSPMIPATLQGQSQGELT
jgi:hypothetical protein